MHDKLIINILIKDNRILLNSLRKINKGKYPNILSYLNTRYNDSDSISETLRRIQYKIEQRPICKYCGGHVAYKGYYNGILQYCQCCCASCNAKYTKDQRYKTNIKKYGRANFGNLNKVKQHLISKYGVDNPAKIPFVKEKIKNTCLKKYGVNCASKSSIVKEKTKQTCLKKYGVDNPWKSKEIIEKSKLSLIKHYGVEYPIQSNEIKEKIKNTMIERYGAENTFSSYILSSKCKETMIEKYGVTYSMQIPKNKEYMSYLMSSKEMQDHRYKVMKRNHTFNTSKPEDILYTYIKEKFQSVKRQHKDDIRYPWFCDFYIPELDYFIELQGYYTHGKHPFNRNSKEDLALVEQYKIKYGEKCQAITIWTIKDVEKREFAKRNNLNFKEVWSLNEGKEFVNKLYNYYIKNNN